MHTNPVLLFLSILVSGYLFTGCNSKDSAAGGPTIFTGKTVELANEKIGESGILYIEKPGDSLDGMLMYIPDRGFAASRRFRVSYEPITSHDLGPDFNPISPLITISCGGGFSDSVITMEIPIRLPEGHFAMGFLYDDRTGKLEGMPILKLEKDRIVVALRNFSHSTSRKGSPLAAQAGGGEPEEVSKIVMSAVTEKKLLDPYDSGFKPGVDDSPATNHGSIITPKGFCSGQSQLMMWYYSHKKKNGSPGLFTAMEADGGLPTPGFWQDDTKAILLSSLIQDEEENSLLLRELRGFFAIGGILATDLLTLYAFQYAIRLTKEPQYIAIAEEVTAKEGHAILVYKTEKDVLYIADPNKPGDKSRKVFFDRTLDKFLYYNGAVRANAPVIPYKSFTYMGSRALVSHDGIESLWKKMEAGKLKSEKLPEFTLKAYNKTAYVPFEDGFRTEENGDALSLSAECSVPVQIIAYLGTYPLPALSHDVKRGNGNSFTAEGSFRLTAGKHRVGVYIVDFATKEWIGFRWVNMEIEKEKEHARPRSDHKPLQGDLSVIVTINGERFELVKSSFGIGETFMLTSDSGDLPYKLRLSIRDWKGKGEYTNAVINWMSRRDKDAGDYLDKNGKITIATWGEGKLEGLFSFEAYDDYYKRTVKGEGFFWHKSPGY